METVLLSAMTGAVAAFFLGRVSSLGNRLFHYYKRPIYRFDLASSKVEDGSYRHFYGHCVDYPKSEYSTDGMGRAWVVEERPVNKTTGELESPYVAFGPYLSGLPYHGRYKASFRLYFQNVKQLKEPILKLDVCETLMPTELAGVLYVPNQAFSEKTFLGKTSKVTTGNGITWNSLTVASD